jgi:hypothetical protein
MSNNVKFTVGTQSFEIVQRPHFKFDILEGTTVRGSGLTAGEVFEFFSSKLAGAVDMIGKLNELSSTSNESWKNLVDTITNHSLADGSRVSVDLDASPQNPSVNVTFNAGTPDEVVKTYRLNDVLPNVWFWRLATLALSGLVAFQNFF